MLHSDMINHVYDRSQYLLSVDLTEVVGGHFQLVSNIVKAEIWIYVALFNNFGDFTDKFFLLAAAFFNQPRFDYVKKFVKSSCC